jgi:hypothetical protein
MSMFAVIVEGTIQPAVTLELNESGRHTRHY